MWKKYFRAPPTTTGNISPISGNTSTSPVDPVYSNWKNALPEIYIGHPNRIERYNQYMQCDQDSEVNAALDILAEFCSQNNLENDTPFDIKFSGNPTDNEINIVKEQLKQWVKLNELNQRVFKIVRNTLKFGDQVFIRDPETFKLFYTEIGNVTKVVVNESAGKRPEQYFIKDISPNFQNLAATAIPVTDTFSNSPQTGGGGVSYNTQSNQPYTGGGRFTHAQNEMAINSSNIVHISLTEGLDSCWPFGVSVLESIYKVFKQKELLEDSIIIYRIQRASEHRVFKIDTGNMPTHMAMAFVERIKNEVHQRRMPSHTANGTSIIDATYSPIQMNEDFFFPQNSEGKGSSVEILQGGQNVGEITDLRYFTNKMFRGLRIPSSYLPTTVDESDRTNNDGKTGVALIQEWRFNQYCKRLQAPISLSFDKEFKAYLAWKGVLIDNSSFNLALCEPQNFATHMQAEIDATRIQSFTQLEQTPYLAKRFLLKRYLGLSEEEILENERMWEEENVDEAEKKTADLRAVGITPGGISSDIGGIEDMEASMSPEEGGAEGSPSPGPTGPEPTGPTGGAAAAAGEVGEPNV